MAIEPFDERTQDWEFTQGDTANLLFDFGDENNVDIGQIASQDWDSKFTLEDFIDDTNILLTKTHNDISPSGDGVYYNGDAFPVLGLNITKDSQVAIVLEDTDTAALKPGVYPYYFKFFIDENFKSEFTAVKGFIKITKRDS